MPGDTKEPTPSSDELLRRIRLLEAAASEALSSNDKIDVEREKVETKLEDVQNQLQELLDMLLVPRDMPPGSPAIKRKGARKPRLGGMKEFYRQQAAQGIWHYEFAWTKHKKALVQVNGLELKFPRALAEVLELLVHEGQEWWMKYDLAKKLAIGDGALTQRISMIRKLLIKKGVNPLLVETEGEGTDARVRLVRQRPVDGSKAAITVTP